MGKNILKALFEKFALHQLKRRAKCTEGGSGVQITKIFRRGNPSAAELPHSFRQTFIPKIPLFPPGNMVWVHLMTGKTQIPFFAINLVLSPINFVVFFPLIPFLFPLILLFLPLISFCFTLFCSFFKSFWFSPH